MDDNGPRLGDSLIQFADKIHGNAFSRVGPIDLSGRTEMIGCVTSRCHVIITWLRVGPGSAISRAVRNTQTAREVRVRTIISNARRLF